MMVWYLIPFWQIHTSCHYVSLWFEGPSTWRLGSGVQTRCKVNCFFKNTFPFRQFLTKDKAYFRHGCHSKIIFYIVPILFKIFRLFLKLMIYNIIIYILSFKKVCSSIKLFAHRFHYRCWCWMLRSCEFLKNRKFPLQWNS